MDRARSRLPVPSGISFDRVAGVYDATRGLPPPVVASVADRLARLIGTERTLELGVGTGRWARPLEERGVLLVGIDLSREMLRVARAKGFARPVQADARRLPFRDRTFDGALAVHILHLVYDVPGVLREISRVDGGMLRSVLEHDTERPDIVGAYRAAVAAEGVRSEPPGIGERTIAVEFPPDRLRDATTFHARAPASLRIDELRARTFQYTWSVPAEVHARVVAGLAREFDGQEQTRETRVEIAEWSAARLSVFGAMTEAARMRAARSGPAS
jgi:SAM-dependent methyltransferase